MIVRRLLACFACLSIGIIAAIAVAEDAPSNTAAPAEKPAAATAEQITEWIKQLDHDGFNIRQAAQQKLAGAGTAAIDALGAAALGKSQEAATRAVEILKQHFQGESDSLKQAAEAVLSKIAKSDDPIAARRATAALAPIAKPEPQPTGPPQIVPFRGGPIRIGGGGEVRLEIHSAIVGGKGANSISMKNVDGNKEINVEEDGRKVKIEESAAGKIKMSVTEKVDGKEETKSYEAESADDLKKVHPEAHKIYEQYKQGGGGRGVEIGEGRIIIGGGAFEPARIRIAPVPDGIPPEHLKRLEEAKARLEETRKRLEAELPKLEPQGSEPQAEDKSAALGQLDAALKQLEAARAQLEKSAGDAAAVKQAIAELEAAQKQLAEAKAKLAE